MKVTKENLSEVICKQTGCSKKCGSETLNALLDEMTRSLKKGNDVVITGFGTFTITKRKARTGRNPQTGETIKIPARKAVRFKTGKALKDAVK